MVLYDKKNKQLEITMDAIGLITKNVMIKRIKIILKTNNHINRHNIMLL